MNTLKSFLEDLQDSKKKIICFGTGLMAEEALQYAQIRQAVLFMVDNDKEKQGREIGIGGQFYPVVAPEHLQEYLDKELSRYTVSQKQDVKEFYSSVIILLASGHYQAMRRQLRELGLLGQYRVYIFPELQVAYSAGSEVFFEERILKESLKEYETVLWQYQISGEKKRKNMQEKEAYIRGVGRENRPFVIPRIMIMPTTRCNMRCKGCSSLLPLFEKPSDVGISQILKDFGLFFSGIDECIRITVGGEPFLYPNLKEILEYLLGQEKVLGILLITNSTLLPKPEVLELLEDPKVLLEISDYGHLEKMGRLIQLLEGHCVRFRVLTGQAWTDMGGVSCRGRTEEELRAQYLNCNQSKVIKGFHNGKFHTCARSARMLALGAYQSSRDYFELDENDPPEVIREKLKKMFYSETADACNYCDLGVLPATVIEAGIQMQGQTKKSRYTIVDRQEYEELKKLAKFRR